MIKKILIFFYFYRYCYKSKKLECQKKNYKKIIKIKRTRRDSNVNGDDEENFNEEINLQNYKHDDSIDLDGVVGNFT